MVQLTSYNRRNFIRQASIISLGFLALSRCTFSSGRNTSAKAIKIKLLKDPDNYLDLPEGFSYKIISKSGERMDDGFFMPAKPDGMGTFSGNESGKVIIICNHENGPEDPNEGPFGEDNRLLEHIEPNKLYDAGYMKKPCLGGTTTIIYNEETQQVEKRFLSLAGTLRNCAGGVTPWNSWLTCEEDVSKAGKTIEKDHGYLFEVPVTLSPGLANPLPLKEMGRFNREAVAVDPNSGIVYQTEDRGDGLFYRFIPNEKEDLTKGGKLQALAIKSISGFDTRNWQEISMHVNEGFDVQWIDMDDVLSPNDDLRYRGFKDGAACFARGEGIWYGNREFYFACTNGGKNKSGQVFRYTPSIHEGTDSEFTLPGKLELFAESEDESILHMCDNLTIAPWGDVILCEDNGELNHIKGINKKGEIYDLACNRGSKSEFAGAVFSPSGKTLFVNIQMEGHTLAISGPWETLS